MTVPIKMYLVSIDGTNFSIFTHFHTLNVLPVRTYPNGIDFDMLKVYASENFVSTLPFNAVVDNNKISIIKTSTYKKQQQPVEQHSCLITSRNCQLLGHVVILQENKT